MIRPAIVPTILALAAAGSAAALDHEFAFAPLVIGGQPGAAPEYHVGIEGALASKVLDDYRVIADDSAFHTEAGFRAYGVGAKLELDFALGQSRDYSRPSPAQYSFGEVVRLGFTLDWAIEIRDPRDSTIPLLQIIPRFTYVTYPAQRDVWAVGNDNYMKDRQRWVGLDVWYALPIEGVEVGGGFENALSTAWYAFRAGLGSRQFVQYNAVDIATWQLINMADRQYRQVALGESQSGFNTAVIGGRATVPMFVEDVFGFVEVEASYWLDKDIRDRNRANGLDYGDIVISVGLDWMPK
jgi:hypothetical protein